MIGTKARGYITAVLCSALKNFILRVLGMVFGQIDCGKFMRSFMRAKSRLLGPKCLDTQRNDTLVNDTHHMERNQL
jgi:hypothetical protein